MNFHGQKRCNDTHVSSTDPEAMLARKSQNSESKLAYRGHLLTENRNGLVVGAQVTHAYGNAESHAALQLLEQVPGRHWLTVGADRGYDNQFFVGECHNLRVDAHVAARRTGSAVAPELTLLPGYPLSQRKRKRVEEVFGWLKTVALLRKLRHRGRERVEWMFVFAAAAYNLVRMRTLLATCA